MLRWLWLSLFAVIIDQSSKIWANSNLELFQPVAIFHTVLDSGLNFVLAYNKGAAYSFLADMGGAQHYIFTAIAILISIYILFVLWKLPKHELQQAVAFSLVLGGAVGNLIDRLAYQHVVDFINVYVNNWHLFGYFNMADVFISIGAVLLVLEAFNIRLLKSKIAKP